MAKVQWAIFINYLPEIILKQFTEESHKHYAKTSSAIHEKTPPNGESIAPAPNAQTYCAKSKWSRLAECCVKSRAQPLFLGFCRCSVGSIDAFDWTVAGCNHFF